jgi:hypothetical protein
MLDCVLDLIFEDRQDGIELIMPHADDDQFIAVAAGKTLDDFRIVMGGFLPGRACASIQELEADSAFEHFLLPRADVVRHVVTRLRERVPVEGVDDARPEHDDFHGVFPFAGMYRKIHFALFSK